jgi:glycosylphosphatidylinositol transamidase (GPIT) subunit GPI8
MVEVGKYAEKAASNYVKAHKKHSDEGSIAIYMSEVGNDGLIKLEVIDQISGGERKGDVNSAVDEQLRLREAPGGLRLETVSVRNAPRE